MSPPPLLPPEELRGAVGEGGFSQVGQDFLRFFVELAGLQPDHRVLDVGCGVGRIAIPLTGYLSSQGAYDGFDVMRPAIDWCRDNITPRFGNFRFQRADIFNRAYNPGGAVQASQFRFPYDDEVFDFAILTSVFTHMLPPDLENYFSELARVLKPGGRCLATYFLLNPEAEALLASGRANLPYTEWARVEPEYRTVSAEVPETAVCYEEGWILGRYERHGLGIEAPIRYGSWPGRSEYLSFQDVVVARKASGPSRGWRSLVDRLARLVGRA